MKTFCAWLMRDAEWWHFWPPSGISGGAIMGAIIMAALLLLTGCTAVPTATAFQACGLLQTASDEADLAPAWYLRAGEVLELCGQPDARAVGEYRACAAEARAGYREHQECEALQ